MGTTRRLSAAARPGFTLMEVILVLTLMVLVAAVSWPAFVGWFSSHRLRQAVDNVRTLWVQGRTRAIEEGRAYRFAWSGNNYRLAPDCLEDWPDLGGSANGPRSSGGNYIPGMIVEEALPQGVSFIDDPATQTAGITILFLSDGTAKAVSGQGGESSWTQVVLGDGSGQMRALQLRGLTGVVTVSSLRNP